MRSPTTRRFHWLLLAGALALAASTGAASDAATAALAFSADGQYLAVLSADGVLSRCSVTTAPASRPVCLETRARGEALAWRPGTDGLAVSLDEGDGWDIWLLGSDGERQRLTFHPALECDPQWNALGDTLIFQSNRDGYSRIFQLPMAADAGARPLVQAEARSQYFPRVQPGGNRVAYVVVGGGEPELRLYTPGAAEPERVAPLGAWYLLHDPEPPVWDTGGQRLLYVQRDERGSRLCAYDPHTRRSSVLAEEERIARPGLDAASGQLVYESADGLTVRRVDPAAPARGAGTRRTADWHGLRLTRPVLAAGAGVLAAAIEDRGAVAQTDPQQPAVPLPLSVDDHLYYAERLMATGRASEAEAVYAALEAGCDDPVALAAARLHHVAQLRRAGKAEQAMSLLERLANSEPPLAPPLKVLALQGSVALYEFRNVPLARHTFEEVVSASRSVPEGIVEAIMFVGASSQAQTDAYIDAHAALRRGKVAESLVGARRLAQTAPASALVRRAILDLFDDPYRSDSVQNRANPFESAGSADAVAEILEKLERADRIAPGAPGRDLGSLGQRLRHALLDAEVRAGRLEEARETALRILTAEGVDGSSLAGSLRYYLEADRLDLPMHTLVGRVLLSASVRERLEPKLIVDPVTNVLLLLARLKSALIEGDLTAAEQILGAAYQAFESAAEDRREAEVAAWKPYVHLLAARYEEMRGRWSEAAESYASARLDIVRACPDRGEMLFAIDAARATVALPVSSGPVEDVRRLVPFRMGDSADRMRRALLDAERLTGDAFLFPTGDGAALERAATEYRKIARSAEGTPLEPAALLGLARCLGREEQNRTALECCDHALALDLTVEMRLAILLEKADRIGALGDAWLQADVLDAAARVAPDPVERDFIRLRMADALARAGRRTEASALYDDLRASAPLESQRATADAQADALRDLARPAAKP